MYAFGWRRAPRLIIGFALIVVASLYLGETFIGWATGIVGGVVFVSGTFGLCPACALMGCKVRGPS